MSRYDRSLTVFSPDGRLLQVEYAIEAVKKGSAVVGIRAKDCVILGVEKRAAAKLQDDRTLQKIARLDDNISLAFAGMAADARVLINKARIECQSYRLTVEDAPSVEYMAKFIGGSQQKYTQRGGVRPYGLAVLIGGVDGDGKPQLWATDPSGVYTAWKAQALGRSSKSLLELLERSYPAAGEPSEAEALRLCVRALLEVVESGAKSIDIGLLRKGSPMRMVSEADLEALVAAVEAEKEEERREAGEDVPARAPAPAPAAAAAAGGAAGSA